jgi:DNA-binding winged helix-turn-helix (wHTH) protein
VDAKTKKVQIGEAAVDLSRGLLLDSAGQVIPIRRKAFDLLKLLVQNQGRTVARDELLQAIWPSVTVTDESVTQCARDVRRAIGDPKGKVLRTIPGRGYLLVSHSQLLRRLMEPQLYQRTGRRSRSCRSRT